MLGAIIGDIVGSIYEFDNHRSKDFPLFGAGCDFTDDSVCTIALADAALSGADPSRVLREWCRRYPGRGYGGMFTSWLREPQPAYGSYGNGAAMRVSAAGWLRDSLEDSLLLSDRLTAITHDHPEGMKGARATVHAIVMAREGHRPASIRAEIESTYGYDLARAVDAIRGVYVFNETCQETVPEALICALDATDFEDAIRNAISIGGDSDTVAAIAGAVAEARFGVPAGLAATASSRLSDEMLAVIDSFGRAKRPRRP